MVYCEVCTEGSETAKSGTDEQERHMRHNYPGKQPQPCNAQRTQKGYLCRCRGNRRKEDALTGGDPGVSVTIFREVSRGHSSYGNEPAQIAGGLTKVAKD